MTISINYNNIFQIKQSIFRKKEQKFKLVFKIRFSKNSKFSQFLNQSILKYKYLAKFCSDLLKFKCNIRQNLLLSSI